MSVPVGLGRDGMPLAVQVAGGRFDELTVFRIRRVLEQLLWEPVPLPHQN
jgi:Asp-tRNA(Asn)/Glu-tRNA(Gln) amidotransferase A subunit family amidase